MSAFTSFDPLKLSQNVASDDSAIVRRQKRNIHSILHSYVGWYDPFAELIQNALDSVDKRATRESGTYEKRISILIDVRDNQLTVSDNGTGLDETAFHRFLAPNESFKEDDARGSKGVGATFIAYGFNFIRIDTKTKTFSGSGIMENARDWLHDKTPSENPQVYPTISPFVDAVFSDYDYGASITIKFGPKTKPSMLSWPSLNTAEAWHTALSIKTAMGAIERDQNVFVVIKCIDAAGNTTTREVVGIGYIHPHTHLERTKDYDLVIEKIRQNLERRGAGAPIPASVSNLEAISIDWDAEKIISHLPKLDQQQKEMLRNHNCRLSGSYIYTAEIWKRFAKKIGYRPTANLYNPGIQLAADNMPQGEVMQVPLQRYTGRQNQVHFLMHFANCTVDLGRKGFDKDFVDIAKEVCTSVVQDVFSKTRQCLKIDDLRKTSLLEKQKITGWKTDLLRHESNCPLNLKNKNFFNPINEISITSEPSREQDVIALFNQLIAGGVIRGIRIVGTNERMTYDGAFRICVGPEYSNHKFDATSNPLGISATLISDYEDQEPDGFSSSDINILEYKYSIDGLVRDLNSGDKKASEIDLIVAWEVGDEAESLFRIQSLLTEDGRGDRDYHGLTHKFFDEHGVHVMDGIILRDLVSYLNDPATEIESQSVLYD